jgi:hypothetical protein
MGGRESFEWLTDRLSGYSYERTTDRGPGTLGAVRRQPIASGEPIALPLALTRCCRIPLRQRGGHG